MSRDVLKVLEEYLLSYTKETGEILRVLIAVSGGVDSMALLGATHKVYEKCGIHIHAAHLIHHPESNEAKARADLIRDYCEQQSILHVIEEVKRTSPKGKSLEEWMREERYHFLERVAKEYHCNYILTGHHADDQAETVLFRVLTGSGIGGLQGIRSEFGRVLRPFLKLTKRQLIEYCKKCHVPYADDPANTDLRFPRNRIRHEILPLIESRLNPDVSAALSRFSGRMVELNEVVDQEVTKCWRKSVLNFQKGKIILDLEAILTYFTVIQKYTILKALNEIAGSEVKLSTAEMDRIAKFLASSRTGSFLKFEKGVYLVRDRQTLVIGKGSPPPQRQELIPGENREIPEYSLRVVWEKPVGEAYQAGDTSSADLDLGDANGSLTLRHARPGDRFHPLGAPGEKRLFRFLTDRRVSRFDKPATLVLEKKNEIVWVVGHRISESARVKDSEKGTWRLKLIPLEGEAN
jgi:tRNA(Ile)-lysidine synthase